MDDQKEKTKDWKQCLRIFLSMFKKKYIGFSDLPDILEIRRYILRPYLKSFLIEYLSKGIKGDSNAEGNEASMVVELCLEISAANYLFEEMKMFYVENNKVLEYVKALEPYILAGKFRNEEIPEDFIEILINKYANDEKMLEMIFLNLNVKGHDLTNLSKICENKKLFILYIYIMTISNLPEDYEKPLILISRYLDGKKDWKSYFETIVEYLKNKPVELDENLFEQTQVYISYLIIWYIDLCFKWKKFPEPLKTEEIDETIQEKPKIIHAIVKIGRAHV